MQNSQIAAVATAISAVALGMFLAVPGNAASPAGAETVAGSVVPVGAEVLSPVVKALSCSPESVRTDASKHFGTPALNGVSTMDTTAWKALEGYLAETGSTAKAAASDFKATNLTVNRVMFTSAGKVTSAVIVDRAAPSLWDWHQAATCT